MRFTVARGELLDSMTAAGRALSARSTLPILSGILVVAEESGSITFQATDLEISIKNRIEGAVDSAGQTVLPGRLILDILRALPEAAVTISVEKDRADVSCGTSAFSVKTLFAEDFPKFPEVVPEQTAVVDKESFTQVAAHVTKAVSRDETRPILTGVLLVVEGPTIRMVGTDSYRLAVKETVLEKVPGTDFEVVVPGKAVDEVSRLAAAGDVEIGVAENQVIFKFGATHFVTRRIEGTYPNYRQLIPKECETTAKVNKEELQQAVKRVSLLAQHNTPLRLSFKSEDQTLTLSATTQDVGEATEDLMVSIEGQDVEIAFNHGFLSDGLSAAAGDEVALEIQSPLKPGILKAPSDEGFLYLLMPVRLG